MDDQIRQRFVVLTWAVGISSGLTIATLGLVLAMAYQMSTLAYQVGAVNGRLDVLIQHVEMK